MGRLPKQDEIRHRAPSNLEDLMASIAAFLLPPTQALAHRAFRPDLASRWTLGLA